jgi:protein phosphatase
MTKTLWFRAAGRSDLGLARENNEDSGFIGNNFLLVADGMGGHAAGELASATAVAIVAQLESQNSERINKDLNLISSKISKEIKNLINKDSKKASMGTTISTCYFQKDLLNIINVGDSRVYLIRDKEIKQLTKDQTYVQTLIDSGEINEIDALNHPQKSMLLQAIDGNSEVIPEIIELKLLAGDKILLCTDGLSGVLTSNQIENIINSFEYVGAVSALIEKTLELGAPDNVTLVLAEVIGKPHNNKIAVLGAAAEPRNRVQLNDLVFPTDIHPFMTGEFPSLKIKSWFKPFLIPAVSLVFIFISIWGFSSWRDKQFFVSNLGENIAIFQGIKSNLGPFSLSTPVQSFDLSYSILTAADQEELFNGIDAGSLSEAIFIVRRLDQRALCSKDASYSFCDSVISSIKPK